MKKLFRTNAKTNNSRSRNSKEEKNYWASDDVTRIAQRTPALFKKNSVPQIAKHFVGFDSMQSGAH